jgi:hypothetical protein
MPLQELPVGASLLSEQHQCKTFDANDNQLFFFLLRSPAISALVK